MRVNDRCRSGGFRPVAAGSESLAGIATGGEAASTRFKASSALPTTASASSSRSRSRPSPVSALTKTRGTRRPAGSSTQSAQHARPLRSRRAGRAC